MAESGYEHPHGHILLETTGRPARGAGPALAHAGARAAAEAIKAGADVTVVAYANRGKPDEARAERITAGGKTVELAGTPRA